MHPYSLQRKGYLLIKTIDWNVPMSEINFQLAKFVDVRAKLGFVSNKITKLQILKGKDQ